MEVDLDFSCFNFEQQLPPTLGSSEELRDDAQHEILMGYPIYITLLKNLQIMKKALDDKTKFIKKLKTTKQVLISEINATKSKLAIAHEDVDRISDNLKIQIERHAEEKERWQTELDSNRSYIEQLEVLSKTIEPIRSCPSPKRAAPEVSRKIKAATLKSSSVQTDATSCKCLQLSLEEDNYEPLQHLESPISLDYDPSDRGELDSELMHAAEEAIGRYENQQSPENIQDDMDSTLEEEKKSPDEEMTALEEVCLAHKENNTPEHVETIRESLFDEPVKDNVCESEGLAQAVNLVEPIVISPLAEVCIVPEKNDSPEPVETSRESLFDELVKGNVCESEDLAQVVNLVEPVGISPLKEVCLVPEESDAPEPVVTSRESLFDELVKGNNCESEDLSQDENFVEPIVISYSVEPIASVKRTCIPVVSKLTEPAKPSKAIVVPSDPVVSRNTEEPSVCEETPKKIIKPTQAEIKSPLQIKFDDLFGPFTISPVKPLITPLTPMKYCLEEAPSLNTSPPKSTEEMHPVEINAPLTPEEFDQTEDAAVEEFVFVPPLPPAPRIQLTPPPEEDYSPSSPDPEPVQIVTQPVEIPTENSDRELEDILQQMTGVPELIAPMSPESRPVKRKLKRNLQEPARKKIVLQKQQEEFIVPSLFDARDLEIISRPLSPLHCFSDDEPPEKVSKPRAKVPKQWEVAQQPEKFSEPRAKVPEQWEAAQFRKRINPGAFVAANKIYKEHLECLSVRDEHFSQEMMAEVFNRLANQPAVITTETLAKAVLLPIMKTTSATLKMDAKPCPMTSVEQRTLYVIHRLQKNCPRWQRLSLAVTKEGVKLLLSSKWPRNINGYERKVVNPMMSRLITCMSLLAKDAGMVRGLLLLSTLYLPLEAAAIGEAVLGVWPQVLRSDSDLKLLRHLWHSRDPDSICRLQQLLFAQFGAFRYKPKAAKILTIDCNLPFELLAPS